MQKLTPEQEEKIKKVSARLVPLVVLELIKRGHCEVDLRPLKKESNYASKKM